MRSNRPELLVSLGNPSLSKRISKCHSDGPRRPFEIVPGSNSEGGICSCMTKLAARSKALGVEIYPYDRRDGAYRLRLTRKDLAAARTELSALIRLAIEERG